MNVLLVRAHHEPRCFCNALAELTEKTLRERGHTVVVSDLPAMGFDPVSDRRNFTTVKDPAYLKQQVEETYATEMNGFAPSLEAEIRKLEAADLIIFSFPLWWFGLPAILKGWVDRVFAQSRIYGGEKLYENGIGKSKKRGLILMSTGGPATAYSGFGVNPSLATVLAPIQHGVFWFNGILPLEPFVAWGASRVGAEQRTEYLHKLETRLSAIEAEKPIVLAPLADFPHFGLDTKKRFMVTTSRIKPADETFTKLIPEELKHVAEFKRQGLILEANFCAPTASPWRVFLLFRESSEQAVRAHLETLPLAKAGYLAFEITELAQV